MTGAYGAGVNPLGRRIVEELRTSGAPLDDEELASALKVRRQVVNQECRALERQGVLVRGVVMGNRTVNALRLDANDNGSDDAGRAAAPGESSAASAAGQSAPGSDPAEAASAAAEITTGSEAAFHAHARRVLSARWGTALQRRVVALPGGLTHPMGLVSGNGRIVGDIVWLDGLPSPAAKSSVVAENVWLIGHVVNAQRRFLVFGHDWEVLSRWVATYRPLLGGVEMWYLDGDRLERLA